MVSAHRGGSSQGLPRSSLCSLRTRALSPALVYCTRVYRGGPGLLAAWRSGDNTARGGGFFSLDGCPAGVFRLVTVHFPLAGLFGERGEMTGSSNLGRWPAVGEASSPTEGQGLGSDVERSQGQGKLPSVGRKKPMGICLAQQLVKLRQLLRSRRVQLFHQRFRSGRLAAPLSRRRNPGSELRRPEPTLKSR